MGAYHYRLKMIHPLDLGAVESWLGHMSAKGLYIRDMGRYWAKFERGYPVWMEHRVFYSEEPLAESERELFQERGWKQACQWGNQYVFAPTNEWHKHELYESAEVQLKKLEKILKLRLSAAKGAIWSLLFYVAIILNRIRTDHFLVEFMRGRELQDMLQLILAGVVLISSIISYQVAKNLREELEIQGAINHQRHREWGMMILGFSHWSLVIILVGTLGSSLLLDKEELLAIPEEEKAWMRVTLNDMEGAMSTQYDHEPYPSWFLPKGYVYREPNLKYNEIEKWDYKEDGARIESSYSYSTFSGLSTHYAEGLTEEQGGQWKVEYCPGFDGIYYKEEGYKQELIVFRDHHILHIEYEGEKQKEDLLTIIEEKWEQLDRLFEENKKRRNSIIY